MQTDKGQEVKKDHKNKQKLPTKPNLVLRMIAGIYLVYLVYGLKDSIFYGTGARQLVCALFGILFFASGVMLLLSSVRRLAAGSYQDGIDLANGPETEKPVMDEKNDKTGT